MNMLMKWLGSFESFAMKFNTRTLAFKIHRGIRRNDYASWTLMRLRYHENSPRKFHAKIRNAWNEFYGIVYQFAA